MPCRVHEELVNKNGYICNAIEAKWSVLKRWIKKTRGGELPGSNNRADWRELVHGMYYRKIMSNGHSCDGGHTFLFPLRSFCQTLALYIMVPSMGSGTQSLVMLVTEHLHDLNSVSCVLRADSRIQQTCSVPYHVVGHFLVSVLDIAYESCRCIAWALNSESM